MPKEPDRAAALAYLDGTVGVTSPPEREKIVAALLAPCTEYGFGASSQLSVLLKLMSKLVSTRESRDAEAYKIRPDRREKDKEDGVPTADQTFRDSPGRVCEQLCGRLDEADVAKPEPDPNRRFPYPTSAQADQLADLLRKRCRVAACFGSGNRILEGMLERRGVSLLALDADTMQDGDDYYSQRIYCREVRRVAVQCLMHFEKPHQTILLFIRCVVTPWRAYIARYPEVPIVIVIGDDTDKKMYEPKPKDIAEVPGFALRQRSAIDCNRGHAALTMCVYERV